MFVGQEWGGVRGGVRALESMALPYELGRAQSPPSVSGPLTSVASFPIAPRLPKYTLHSICRNYPSSLPYTPQMLLLD
jgi:hypothetical protein